MNAAVGKLSDGSSVCRSCFKSIIKLNPSIKLKKYSLEDINKILSGQELEIQNGQEVIAPKIDSNFIFGLIKAVIGLVLLYLGIKYLFLK
jgi:hypothetical protein